MGIQNPLIDQSYCHPGRAIKTTELHWTSLPHTGKYSFQADENQIEFNYSYSLEIILKKTTAFRDYGSASLPMLEHILR